MTGKMIVIGLAFVVSVSGSDVAAGWGSEGHRITADIAFHHISPDAWTKIAPLLDGEKLYEIANWPDSVRFNGSVWEETGPLHFFNVELYEGKISFLTSSRDGHSILGAIAYYTQILSSEETDEWSKKRALRFLVHFIGDLHQPLHVSYKKDYGGNSIDVKYDNEWTNLHKVWDTKMIHALNSDWQTISEDLRSLPPTIPDTWKSLDPVIWAKESFDAATKNAYKHVNGDMIKDDDHLDVNYYNENILIVKKRLQQGGYRLAQWLNRIFDPQN